MDHMQQQQQVGGGEELAGRGGGGVGGVSVCRPSGTRWTPTTEQIKILRELYYSCGIRSPNSEQIQRIAAMLRQYGRIEGKNVFYWFQNHKARERQKKRLTTLDVTTTAADASHLAVLSLSPTGAAAPSSPGFYVGNGGGAATAQTDQASFDCDCTAMATERTFLQDYMGVSGAGVPAAPTPWAMTTTREPETLPLFPVGGGDGARHAGHGGFPSNFQRWGSAAAAATTTNNTTITVQQHLQQHNFYSSSSQLISQDGAAGTSLELTLSSPYPAGSM